MREDILPSILTKRSSEPSRSSPGRPDCPCRLRLHSRWPSSRRCAKGRVATVSTSSYR